MRRAAAALDRVVAAAGDPEVSNDGDATDAALDELILAARNVFVVLESHVAQVEQAAQRYDERDPEEQRSGPADAARPADVEAEPPGDLAGWVRAVNAEVERAERASAEAEQAAAGSGGWWSRFTACVGARERMVRAALSTVIRN